MRNRDKGNGLIIIQRRKGKNKNYVTVPDPGPCSTGIEMQLFFIGRYSSAPGRQQNRKEKTKHANFSTFSPNCDYEAGSGSYAFMRRHETPANFTWPQ